ncbi:MAG: hypothetical protein ACKO3N_10435, partial [Verrucomicrobiota bacterium]
MDHPKQSRTGPAWFTLGLAAALLAAGWVLPARWRSVHPAVLQAAGEGTPGLVEAALAMARWQKAGPASLLLEAAGRAGLSRTNEVTAVLAGRETWPREVRLLGGPDPAVQALFGPMGDAAAGARPSAFDLFLPAAHRARLRAHFQGSRSPGVQALLPILTLPTREFVPADQPGGQPLEAVVYLAATLYERERFSPGAGREFRELAEQAPGSPVAQARLEEFLLDLLTLARRLDWTSLADWLPRASGVEAVTRFSAALRAQPGDLPVLYAGAVLSGDAGATARHLLTHGEIGRRGMEQALGLGVGAVHWLTVRQVPVRPGGRGPRFLARIVVHSPGAGAAARSALLLGGTLVGALGLSILARAGGPEPSASAARPRGWIAPLLSAWIVGGFLVLTSEPLPGRPGSS